MGRLLATVSLAALAIGAALPEAMAYLKAGPPMAGPGHHRLKGAATAVVEPPLDGLTVPIVAFSFRRTRTAYAGNAVRLRRASDNAELDIGFSGNNWDEAAAVAHCASSCFVKTRYNQGSGGSTYDLTSATAAAHPPLIFSCQNGQPCYETQSATHVLASAGSITPATGVATLSAVANRISGTAACVLIRENASAGQRFLSANASANNWQFNGGTSGSIIAAATDNTWHAGIGVANGASSLVRIDATETTGTVTGSVTAGPVAFGGVVGTVCRGAENFIWDNVVLPPAERATLQANQKSFYGTP